MIKSKIERQYVIPYCSKFTFLQTLLANAKKCKRPTIFKSHKLFFIYTIFFSLTVFYTFGQFPNSPKTPKPFEFKPITPGPNQQTPKQPSQQDIQNQKLIQQSQQNQNRQRQQLDELYNDLHEADRKRTINYNFPSLQQLPKTTLFYKAFATLDSMLKGQRPLNLKKAVYTIENAYLDNKLSYSKFNNQIKYITNVCRQKIQHDKLDPDNSEAVNMVIYQVLCDTTDIQNPKTKVFYKSYPYTYDFNDFWGREDYTKQFVSKVLKTHSGQCRSLPLLYLIIAEELKTNAYWTFSPSHTFIRFQLNNGNWQNVELTNGRLSSDTWVLGSGFVKSEALTSQIYMDTIDKKQSIAMLLADLSAEYTQKVGYDDFVLKTLNRSLEIYPNNIVSIMRKADYYTLLLKYVIDQKGKPTLEQLKQDQQANNIYIERNKMYNLIDNSGYEDMPKDAYENWLKSIDNEIQKTSRK
ncbi:MAG: hypothetical protein Q8R57_05600 [Bacteroidota bacterium]|nr:hypothetical protein [Bacteroidota bacterium]